MTARTWLTGLTVCLATGCLYQSSSGTATPPLTTAEIPLPRHEPITRAAGAIDPPAEPVKVEMLPVPVTPSPAIPPLPVAEKVSPLVASLSKVLDKHPAEARKALESNDRPNQNRLQALLELASTAQAADLEGLSATEVATALDQLNDLSRRLRPKAPLKIANACLCRGIQGFGQYERTDEGHAYRAGADGKAGARVQVYAEVGNFASRSLGDGRHETKLATALEVHDADGKCLSKMALGTCADHSLTPRTDYFLNFQFHVPGALEPGAYTLWVVVQDVTASGPPREARGSMPFRVRAK